MAYVLSHWFQEPAYSPLPNTVLYTQSVKPEQSKPYGRMVPVEEEPADVTNLGVFQSGFQPASDFPPQK